MQAAALFTEATGTQSSEQDLCLVYLTDALPEQMGKGKESLRHFCLAVPLPIHHVLTYRPGMANSWLPVGQSGGWVTRERPGRLGALSLLPSTQRFTLLATPVMK